MSALIKGMATVAAIAAAAGAGLWAGQTGVVKLPLPASMVSDGTLAGEGHRTGDLLPRPQRQTSLCADAEVHRRRAALCCCLRKRRRELRQGEVQGCLPKSSERKVKFYRNPMGLPDTSPTPKKDAMGMDYIPVYEDEGDGNSIKFRRAKSSAPASRPSRSASIPSPARSRRRVSFSSMSGAS